jgi:cytochrome c-type biogenesis protein
MVEILGALVAGVLTTLAPCVLPLLPVIVGGSLVPGAGSVRRALVVTAALGASVLTFTMLLRVSTALIGVDLRIWSAISGGLLILLGLVGLFPRAWDAVSARWGLQRRTTAGLSAAQQRDGATGAILTGAALGPVFSSCSPFYAYVIAAVVPQRGIYGTVLLLVYVAGLCAALLAIALAGQRLIRRIGWLADPHGWFRRGLGLVFVLVGVAVALGVDREVQAWVIENSPLRPWELDQEFIPAD